MSRAPIMIGTMKLPNGPMKTYRRQDHQHAVQGDDRVVGLTAR